MNLKLKRLFAATLIAVPTMVAAQTYPIEINEENFPDENFRVYLLAQDYGADGIIDANEIVHIDRVVVGSNSNIRSLKGLEFFPSLTILWCTDVPLTSLDVSKNTKLEVLNCSSCSLTSLDVSNNTVLKELYCSFNPLSSLNVSTNSLLERLNCTTNMLSFLDVSNNKKLKYLECSDNQLASLKVSGCSALSGLDCSVNQLTSLDVSECIELRYLMCAQNKIRGASMDALMNSLPMNTTDTEHSLTVYCDGVDDIDNCTKNQVAIAKAKGWSVKKITYLSGDVEVEYEGYATSEISMTDAEYTAYVTEFAVDFTMTEGLTAYIVLKATEARVVLQPTEVAPAGTAVILNGKESIYTLYPMPEVDAFELWDGWNNVFYPGGDITGDGKTIYALADKENGVGFYLVAAGVAVPANKGYLVIDSETSKAKAFIPFGDGVTGINSVAKSVTEGAIYNLAGQRVTEPTQNGIYIMNGKKVFINK